MKYNYSFIYIKKEGNKVGIFISNLRERKMLPSESFTFAKKKIFNQKEY